VAVYFLANWFLLTGVFKHLDIPNRYQSEKALLPLPAF